jgi:hypothetical protein
MNTSTSILTILAISFTAMSHAAPPKGWWSAPSDEYQIGVDASDSEKPAAYIESVVPAPKQFIALNQTFSANDYRGKRVRLKGMIKTKEVSKWAGFWLRADNEKNKIVAFDNMQQRGISGTTDWTAAEIVLEVPSDAERMFLGLILDGKGKAWMRGLTFEIVDDSVAVTAPKMSDLPKAPTNLDFTEK